MLREGVGFKKVILVCGKTDLRKGSSGLAAVIQYHYGLNALEEGTLFLFCGINRSVIKGLLFEGLSAHFCYLHIFLESLSFQ